MHGAYPRLPSAAFPKAQGSSWPQRLGRSFRDKAHQVFDDYLIVCLFGYKLFVSFLCFFPFVTFVHFVVNRQLLFVDVLILFSGVRKSISTWKIAVLAPECFPWVITQSQGMKPMAAQLHFVSTSHPMLGLR